jgi:hypothetical protein
MAPMKFEQELSKPMTPSHILNEKMSPSQAGQYSASTAIPLPVSPEPAISIWKASQELRHEVPSEVQGGDVAGGLASVIEVPLVQVGEDRDLSPAKLAQPFQHSHTTECENDVEALRYTVVPALHMGESPSAPCREVKLTTREVEHLSTVQEVGQAPDEGTTEAAATAIGQAPDEGTTEAAATAILEQLIEDESSPERVKVIADSLEMRFRALLDDVRNVRTSMQQQSGLEDPSNFADEHVSAPATASTTFPVSADPTTAEDILPSPDPDVGSDAGVAQGSPSRRSDACSEGAASNVSIGSNTWQPRQPYWLNDASPAGTDRRTPKSPPVAPRSPVEVFPSVVGLDDSFDSAAHVEVGTDSPVPVSAGSPSRYYDVS